MSYNMKTKAVRTYMRAAKLYNDNLKDKDILVLYRGESLSYYIINFKASNFFHYTGTNSTLSPVKFFKNAVDKKLSVNDFEFKDAFTSNKKLDVLELSMKFIYMPGMIGLFNGIKIKLDADVGIGKESFVLTFRSESDVSGYF